MWLLHSCKHLVACLLCCSLFEIGSMEIIYANEISIIAKGSYWHSLCNYSFILCEVMASFQGRKLEFMGWMT